ncbi:MAG: serine hydrolase domain-containing protein [Gemmatimonadales bacterium]|jgi:CubicO group peptidase (beta-lactamase class C family)
MKISMLRVAAALIVSAPEIARPAALQAQQGRAGAVPGWAEFTRAFDAYADSGKVVGGSAVLVRDGRIVARHDYGLADRSRAQPVNDRTIFHYGSITKTLTAIAILQLRDRGRLTLDDRVTSYIPELRRVHDPYGAMDSITIRMLLSHSAGFQNPTWPYKQGKDWEPFEPTSWEQLVAMMPYQELLFRPGTRWSYSNPAYIYLARIIEQLTGDPWETYVQKNILSPLELTRSYFGATPYYLAANRADSYAFRRDSSGHDVLYDYGREFDPGITIPNGGWNAPLADLAAYAAFLTGSTHPDTALARRYDVVLGRASLEEMWRPVLAVGDSAAPDGGPESMGLGFFVVDRGGYRLIGHTGSQAGFLAFLWINPATGTAAIAALNTNTEVPGAKNALAPIMRAMLALLH